VTTFFPPQLSRRKNNGETKTNFLIEPQLDAGKIRLRPL
jgi:hypothetical protein